MISVPATNHATPVGDAESVQDAGWGGQELDTNELNTEPLAPAIVEENDTDIPELLDSLEVDRASVEETQVGSEPEDNALETGVPNGIDAQDQGQEQGDDKEQNSAMDNVQTQNGSRSTNSEDTAESDAKTIDTVATSASAEVSNKLSSPTSAGLESALSGKAKGTRSSRNSPVPSSIWTRGRQSRGDRVLGQTGLSNLGNTCYMNSALQCIRSVEELTKYFLADEHYEEVNRNNPLGHNGDVALAYGYLLKQIYKDPPPNSTTPRSFKDTVGRYAPQFSGWGQQDTQEFLGFLLDGLQEDLNRVKKKPYIEKPDSTDEMVNDPEAIRGLAAQVWDIHKKRDDSIISDLFTGLYKSTLVCPECDKVSITFDPFTNLTLPLPIQNIWCRKIKYFPLNDVPVTINVELDKTASIRNMKDFISVRVGVPSERIIGAEEYKDKFFKIYEDSDQACGEITKDDIPAFYELEDQPTNIKRPGKRKVKALYSYNNDRDEIPNWDDPMAERLVVPVLHRLNPRSSKESRIQTSRNSENISPPHFIVLDPKEAQDEDMIRRKVLEKVATFTTWPKLSCLHSAEPTEKLDQDQSGVTSSDVESSGDGMVTASSVEGEEDMVDVSMQDAVQTNDASQQEPESSSALLRKFNSRRPDFINPEVYLEGELQNLFDLSFFKEDALVPTGWHAISSSDRLFPRLDTRRPRPPTPSDDDMPSPSGSGTATEESSAEEVDDVPDTGAQTRMVDEVSEEDSDTSLPDLKACLSPTWSFPTSEQEPNTVQDVNKPPNLPLRPQDAKLRGGKNGGRKKIKAHKTYSKKAQKRFNKQQQQRETARRSTKLNSIMDEDPEWGSKVDGGPLVRLGEGIIVDWDPAAWDMVFGQDVGGKADSTQGSPTFLNLQVLRDPQLEAKSQARRMRHNKGISLDDCLNEFEKDEVLSEEDKWYCPRCKEHRRAAKKFDIWKTPDILVVHLKRFSSSGTRRDKIDAVVDFPIEGLDISHRVLEKEDGKQEIYDLIAIDDHMGGLGGGHYTAFAKNFVDGQWYKFDDSFAGRFKNTQAMITSHAYLLFYRRRSDHALGGPKFEEILRRFDPVDEDDDDDSAVNSEGSESR